MISNKDKEDFEVFRNLILNNGQPKTPAYLTLTHGQVTMLDNILNSRHAVVVSVDDQYIKGSYYWVITALDPDCEKSANMTEEPAEYLGDGKWSLIGSETDWPVRWVGEKIGPTPPNAALDDELDNILSHIASADFMNDGVLQNSIAVVRAALRITAE